ncbi:MAG: 50S ribosomal protein L24, partial [Bacteroidota bacterium]
MKKSKNTKPVKKKLHVRTGDFVKVIAGNEKGKSGEILSVDLAKERAVVEGLNLRTRHKKPTANNPEGSLEEF